MIYGRLVNKELSQKVRADPRDTESSTNIHSKVTHGHMRGGPKLKPHRDQKRVARNVVINVQMCSKESKAEMGYV